MKLSELLIEAKKHRLVDLEALILFVVFEKKVHSLTDDSDVLDIYFLDKHKKRMNKLLDDFKQQKGVEYFPSVYEVKTDSRTVYVTARDEEQAKLFVKSHGRQAYETRLVMFDELVKESGTKVEVTKEYPKLIGGH